MTAPRFRKFVAADGSHRWTLIAGNGEIVATSEGYTRAADRDRAIVHLKRIVGEISAVDTWNPPDDDLPVDHLAARQHFARRATDPEPDGPDEAA